MQKSETVEASTDVEASSAVELVGRRLPSLRLTSASGNEVRLRTHTREATVALLLPPEPGPVRPYLEKLLEHREEIDRWDGRLIVVTEGDLARGASRRAIGLPVAADPGGALRQRLALPPDHAWLLIADRFGQIYHAARAGPPGPGNEPPARGERLPGGAHAASKAVRPGALPSPDEIVEWLKFLATQCPECGVIDQPGYGEWAPRES